MSAPGDTVAALQVLGVSKSFVGTHALRDVNLAVKRGEIHALLGENGAGKSTLMKILCGVHQPDEGEILIEGVGQRFASHKDAVKAGVGIAFQEFSLIPDLGAVDNIFLGRELRGRFGVLDRTAMRGRAEALFDRLGVAVPLDRPVRVLSVAQQQFVEIAKALASDARILILDEPTATLTPAEVEHLFSVMRELKRQDVAIIFISHHMQEIFEICDRVTVLRDGRWVGETNVSEVSVDELVEMMVGRRVEASFPPKPSRQPDDEIVLDVEELQIERGGPVNRFQVRKGEILGFAGLVGSGRTETALAVLGALRAHRKTVKIEGRPAALNDPADALRLGVGLLPESRKTEGLVIGASVQHNITLNNLAKYCRIGPFIDGASERSSAETLMAQVRIKASGPDAAVQTLSGGNQQKVVIARWLDHHARILFFDEPTRGIDVGAKAEIYQLMRRLAAQGLSIVMISSELPEIVGICDRVAVFRRGEIVAVLEEDGVTPNNIMRHAAAGE